MQLNRFRIGNYRVIFDLEGDEIVVLRAGHRKDIYIEFQIMILARPEGGIRVSRTYRYVVEDSD